jgi:carbonic anhydrase
MFDDLLQANDRYATQFALAGIPAVAARNFALVTCMDCRIEPLAMLGLAPGDANILRNAGGRVTTDVLRSLILATNLLGVRRIAVMHHTKCALANRSDGDIRSELPGGPEGDASEWDFLTMLDPDESLAADVAALRSCPLFPGHVVVEGWRYQVETGRILRIIPAAGL